MPASRAIAAIDSSSYDCDVNSAAPPSSSCRRRSSTASRLKPGPVAVMAWVQPSRIVDPVVKPSRPASHDEEILGAEEAAVLSLLDDAGRIEVVARELRTGFAALTALGPAVTIFGSPRTPPDAPDYATARLLGRRLGEAGFPIITGGGPGAMEAANC